MSESPVRIRPAFPRDAAALVELARAVASEPERWLVTEGEWRSVRAERRYLRSALGSSAAAVLVAEDEHDIVGRISVLRDAQPACEHVADVGLMVAKAHRRRGIGTSLLRAAEAWARGVGIRKLELHVFPYNEAARRLYEQAGYREVGVRPRHFRLGARFVDAILMSKEIG